MMMTNLSATMKLSALWIILVAGLFLAGCRGKQAEFEPVDPSVASSGLETDSSPAGFYDPNGAAAYEEPEAPKEPIQQVHVVPRPPSPQPEQATAPGVHGNRFQVGDVVTVSFSGIAQPLPIHEERIKEDGTITLQYVGPVTAAGKSPGELQRYLQEAYKKYYKNLVVTVKSFQRYFYVGGEVRQPGPQPWLQETTVLTAIQTAGDFTDFAKKSKVQIVRTDGTVLSMDCGDAIKDPSLDLPIYPGDRINVPRRVF